MKFQSAEPVYLKKAFPIEKQCLISKSMEGAKIEFKICGTAFIANCLLFFEHMVI